MASTIPNKLLTLAFVRERTSVLLGLKLRGFGEGRWNGFGGKVQPEETIEHAAKRELQEECGLIADSLDEVGILMFEFVDDPQLLEVHVFSTNQYRGSVQPSDEMRPQWYDIDALPFKKMWPDDHLWFPYLLRGAKFYGYFTFKGMDTILAQTLYEVPSLDSVAIPKGPHESPNKISSS